MVPTSRVRRRPRSTQEARVSHELFRDVTDRRPRASRTTGGTLAVSIAAHTLMVAAAIVMPLLAADVLPNPVEGLGPYVVAQPLPDVPAPRPIVQRAPTTAPATNPNVAPVEAHAGIEPERAPQDAIVCETCTPDPDAITSAFGPGGGNGPAIPSPPPPAPAPPKLVRAGGAIKMPTKIHEVAPDYPQIAQKSGIEGMVIIEAIIDVDGTVRDARILRSIPFLDRAALDAVRQWRYEPTRLNGVVVPVAVTVTVQFHLSR
jgi:TonB family protein